MPMERRVLVAVFLSFLVLYGYQAFFVPQEPPPSATSTPQSQPVTLPADTRSATESGSAPPSPGTLEQASPAPVSDAPLVGEADERDIRVESDLVTAVFTNRGAVLKSWRLKRYLDDANQPLELVPAQVTPNQERPFTLGLGDPALDARLGQALFRVDSSEASRDATAAPVTLTFEFHEQAGLRVRKAFSISPASYVVTVEVTVEQDGQSLIPALRWGPALGDVTGEVNQYLQRPEGILFRDGAVERIAASSVSEQPTHDAVVRFAGVDDHYFLSAALDPGPARVEYAVHTLPHRQTAAPLEFVSYAVRSQQPPLPARFFVGPKDFDVLAAVDRDLVRVINFGWFSWIVVPLLRSLKWINGYVGNYGWAIIILTVLINAAMFPLRHKSVVSMRRMQELQPEMKAIQDRYGNLKATDPARQKMNVELMNLYRERGVNPASGCIPMLLTMPVLFAFYSLLSVAIEIRGAPFFGWIRDLSVYDPMYVTPILMGITMVVQQRMTPSTADPVQQKMLMAMPVVFTFMFLWAPSGLVLYWLISNVWAIGQQHFTNRLIGPPVVRTVRPAAERRVKRVGTGKTEGAKDV